jgi:OOP family OmpA-OmpF porin
MNMRITIAATACAMLIAVQAKAAGDSGFYAGASGGLAQTGINETGFKENDIAFKVFGGYSITDLIAFEGAYIDGGNPSIGEPGDAFADASVTAINASVLLRARTGSSFALFAKIGYAMYDFKVAAAVPGIAAVESKQSDSGVSYGLGVTYTIARKYLVRAEFEGLELSDASFYMVTIGAGYRF